MTGRGVEEAGAAAMDGRTRRGATAARCGAWLLLLAAAGCTCGGEESPAPAGPPAAPAPPAPPPSPPPSSAAPAGLQPAAQPVLSAAVPVGFEREPPPPGGAPPDQPWVHLRGRAPLDDVVEFYTRYLDPGTPDPVGAIASGGDATPSPHCVVRAVGPRTQCPPGTTCPAEKSCVLHAGGAIRFTAQHPRPPGETGALVNVVLTTVGGQTRITIENESLLRILRENTPEGDFPPQPDLTKYRTMEEIPSEFID